MELDAEVGAELLQVTGVSLVANILHADVDGLYGETGVLNARPFGQQFSQQQRVFATRKAHKNLVIILDETISGHRLDEPFIQTFLKATALILFIEFAFVRHNLSKLGSVLA